MTAPIPHRTAAQARAARPGRYIIQSVPVGDDGGYWVIYDRFAGRYVSPAFSDYAGATALCRTRNRLAQGGGR